MTKREKKVQRLLALFLAFAMVWVMLPQMGGMVQVEAEEETYTIRFYAGEGHFGSTPGPSGYSTYNERTVDAGSTIGDVSELAKSCYSDVDGYGIDYWVDEDGHSYQTEDFQDLIPEKDMLFTVIWKECPVLTFDLNGGTYESGGPGGVTYSSTFELTYYRERGLSLNDNCMTRDGYVFAGWKVISGTDVGEVYKSGELSQIYHPLVDSTLQATWRDASSEINPEDLFWVTFDAGADCASVNLGPGGRSLSVQCRKGETVSNNKVDASRNGFIFQAWCDANGNQYSSTEICDLVINEDLILTALWEPMDGVLLTDAFVDENFRAYVSEEIDTDGNGELSAEEIKNVTEIDCSSRDIESLSGIDIFYELTELYCSYNQLSRLDLSANKALCKLVCSYNELTSLNLSKNVNLVDLGCLGNALTSLDLGNNTLLRSVNCSSNKLYSINFSQNNMLEDLVCYYNNLSELDVSQCYSLEWLECYHNEITSLILNSSLSYLNCDDNQLSVLDVGDNANLYNLSCNGNRLTSLNLSKDADLNAICCADNMITELDLGNYKNLQTLNCSNNPLGKINVKGMKELNALYCDNNGLESLELGDKPNLCYLRCSGNELTELDVSKCPKLSDLCCQNNKISDLNIGNNSLLQMAYSTGASPVDTYYVYYDIYEYPHGCDECTLKVDQTVKISLCCHSWDSGKITKAPTCTENGVRTYTCTSCGEEKTEAVKATGHTVVRTAAVAATTEKTGLTEGIYCSVCGTVFKKQEVIPKLTPPTTPSTTPKTPAVKNGWKKESGKWFYYVKGTKQKGWKQIGKKWYFFKKDGSMAANEWCKGYWLNKDGTWTYKKKATWKKDATSWWFGCKGWYAKNQWQKIDDKWYYFNAKGYIVTGTRKIGGKQYKFNKSGVCLNP